MKTDALKIRSKSIRDISVSVARAFRGYLSAPCVFACFLVFGCMSSAFAAVEHDFEVSTRLRYSDLENGSGDSQVSGEAVSALLRLALNTDWNDYLSTFAQVDHTETGYDNRHSDGVRFNGLPEITDVGGTDLNQLYFDLTLGDWLLRSGRQKIAFDQQRFVGSVSFWQNEQTFDALFVQKDILSESQIHYTYVGNVNRIFGDDANSRLEPSDINFDALNGARPLAALGDHEHQTHLLRAEFNEWDYSKLVGYTYFIDNQDAPGTSSNTFGLRYRLKIKPQLFQYRLELEAASQKRTELATQPQLSYLMADIGVAYQSVELSARWEQLGAKDGTAFFVPLATLHDFHGWADQFNIPPGMGLVDRSLQLKWRAAPFQFDARLHVFGAEDSDQNFGQELDFDIIYKPLKRHTFMLRFADFQSDGVKSVYSDKRRIFFEYAYNL